MRLKWMGTALAGLCLLVIPVAMAVQTPIEDVVLVAGDGAAFDPENNQVPGNDDCLTADIRDENANTPVEDGISPSGLDDDGFDDGLVLLINGRSFVDPDDNGNLVGQQLTVGPQQITGFRVRRIDRALQAPGTLRSLIALKNTKRKARGVNVQVDNDYGTDVFEVVRGSSNAPKPIYSKADRWVVIADDATSPDDAIVTQAFSGKDAREAVEAVPNNIPNADSCLNVRYRIKVPGRSTRYLMLFTQLHDSDKVSLALQRAEAFNKNDLPNSLQQGLTKQQKKKIVNWDLG